MSGMCQGRHTRWQEIQKGLQFIQSTLPFPGSQEHYEVFIQDLVCNLFGEGNDVFKEGEWTKSIEMYTEALSVADYANSEDIAAPAGLLEKLYANRAAAYLNIVPGLYDQALEDCEQALELNQGNYKALYRKAKSLTELGKHQEAYEAVAKCSLTVPQDPQVVQLTQDLAKTLGLKIRKAYIRSKPALNVGSCYSDVSCEKVSHGSASVEDIDTDLPQPASNCATPVSVCVEEPRATENPMADAPANGSSHHVTPDETHCYDPLPMPATSPTPLPVSLPVPTLVNGSRAGHAYTLANSCDDDYDGEIIGEDLDDLLDQAGPVEASMVGARRLQPLARGSQTSTNACLRFLPFKGPAPLPTSISSVNPMPSRFYMPSSISPFLPTFQECTIELPPLYHQSGSSMYLGMDSLDSVSSPLDSLDSLSISEFQTDFALSPFATQMNNHDNPTGMALGMPDFMLSPANVDVAKNPLADTHEFKQACSQCFVKTGHGVLDYALSTEKHKCKKDALLGRMKHMPDQTWKLIRPRPTKNQYAGPYYICKEVAIGEECLYPGHCTFAYCQEEIDVWTLERKGFISRELLFDPFGSSCNITLTVPKILQEHRGIFMFLCGVCFDHKPRIISKANKENSSLCSHPVTKHDFEENKCLVHIFNENTVRYSKIRPLKPHCQLDVCRHEVRYGCVREEECFYAHSLIELKVWMMQRDIGISHGNIVQEARKYWNVLNAQGSQQQPQTAQRKFGPPNLKLMFVCGQCWRNGQVSEADKNKKYCTAKARHTWSKDKRVVLVSSNERKKWTTVRPIPTKKPIPSQFEICMHVTTGKKCQYIGNCTFAHSVEERDLWTFMKESNIGDLDQLYDEWLQSQKPSWSEEMSNNSVRENGKQIHMPTDYADEVQAGNHCWLCGKNCNSDKQWQQHITSEKHKDKVFNSEDDQNCWQYRFPTGTFKVCERYLKGTCIEEHMCPLAHGPQELKEWNDRREFLLMKFAKARKDHLIAPNDNDFGKYSFLLKYIK